MDSAGKGTGLAEPPQAIGGFLSLKETIKYLNVSKAEIEKLVKSGRLMAYRLGGSHLRFRKDQLLVLKHDLEEQDEESPFFHSQKIEQFWAFNGFYIVTGFLLSGVLFYFLRA